VVPRSDPADGGRGTGGSGGVGGADGVGVDPSPQRATYQAEEAFLRGRQITDDTGPVEFRTIYPGWYPGRTVHVHLMVRTRARTYTSQLYFPEDATSAVFAHDPYLSHGLPDTTHSTDGIFATGGQPAVLEIGADSGGHLGVICLVLPEHGPRRPSS
jgi:hypothetical protein